MLNQNLKNWLRRVAMLAMLAGLTACATTPPAPYDYSAFREAKPTSLLLLPPLNDSPDVAATYSVLSQLTRPLAESGFYVLPVSLVDETLKQNGVANAPEIHAIDPAKLRQIFGADAAVYVRVKRYGSVYKVIASETAVEVEARVVDLRSGKELWKGTAAASSAEQGGGGQQGLLGVLVKAIVEQIANNVSDRSNQIAGIAGQRLLGAGRPNGMLYGPRSPLYVKPQ